MITFQSNDRYYRQNSRSMDRNNFEISQKINYEKKKIITEKPETYFEENDFTDKPISI